MLPPRASETKSGTMSKTKYTPKGVPVPLGGQEAVQPDCHMILQIFMPRKYLAKLVVLVCLIVTLSQTLVYVLNSQKLTQITLSQVSRRDLELPTTNETRTNGVCIPTADKTIHKKYISKPILCFDFIIPNKNLCREQHPLVLIYVYSSPGDFRKRLAIRNTWGNRELLTGKLVRIIFPLGLPKDPKTQKAIIEESKTFDDIVQANFYEDYKNLSYKGITTLRWITENCSNARFVLKVDSDVFVNMLALIRRIRNELTKVNSKFFACAVKRRVDVIRCGDRPKLKSCTNRTQFRPKHYPTYCQGGAFLTDTATVKALYNASFITPIWWIDDVFITGILPRNIPNIKHIKLNNFWEREEGHVVKGLKRAPRNMLFAQVKNVNHMLRSWQALKHNW